MKQPEFNYEILGQTLVIHMPEEVDHHNCRDLKYETDLLLAENYITRIVFDFGKTEFMDSSGIGVILGRYKQMGPSRGRVCCYGAGPQVMRILKASGITRLIEACEDRQSALNG